MGIISRFPGGGGDFYFERYTPLNPIKTISCLWNNIPDVIVIVGPVSGASPDTVGLAIHIKDANGGVYQEKWRYQSTKYLIGTSATDGSLFTLSKYSGNDGFSITINSGESSYGDYFGGIEYKIFAAKLY